MATVTDEVGLKTIDDEREQLLSFGMPELRVIADEIGAEGARSKNQLVENILAKKTGQEPEVLEEEAVEEKEEGEDGSAPEQPEETEPKEAPALPVAVKHLMLTMFDRADDSIGVKDQVGVNKAVDEWLAKGYDVRTFDTLGFSPGGHKLFWVFEKTDQPKFTRSMHLMRLLTPQPNPIRGTITGWQADEYISAFIEAGWTLIGAKYNGDDVLGETTTGIYIIWMLAK